MIGSLPPGFDPSDIGTSQIYSVYRTSNIVGNKGEQLLIIPLLHFLYFGHAFPSPSLLRQGSCLPTFSFSMALPEFFSVAMQDSLAPGFQQLSLLLALIVVIVLAARLSYTIIAGSKHFKAPRRLRTFARFFYASFLKPHDGDGAITGQQAALESFYKAQVLSPGENISHT